MAADADQLTQDAIQAVISAAVGIGAPVTATSTTSDIYAVLHPISVAAAIVIADAERILYAQSWLAARGPELDAIGKHINARRLPHETDDSFRNNAPKMFTPGASFSTELDKEEVLDDRELDLADIKAKSQPELMGIMRATFQKLRGDTCVPTMVARLWEDAAVRLAELYIHIGVVASNLAPEESHFIGNTDWIYRSDALRVPGVLDAAVTLTAWNQITLWVRVDGEPGRDARNRRIIFNESETLEAAASLAEAHLPPQDRVTLKPPMLRVLPAQHKPVWVDGAYSGTATVAEVRAAISDYFHGASIGEAVDLAGLDAAVAAVAGVTFWSRGAPSGLLVRPSTQEVVVPSIMVRQV